MSEAKIRLSAKEAELIGNAEIILTKNAILRKVNELLAGLQQDQRNVMTRTPGMLPIELLRANAKISRGENYKGLPYQVLDHPRVFEQEHIAAMRTMFLWGNFFSVTLHLSGKYKTAAEEKLLASFAALRSQGFFICIHEEQWEHHFGNENYKALADCSEATFRELVQQKPFVKLANKVALQEWEQVPAKLLAFFEQLVVVLRN